MDVAGFDWADPRSGLWAAAFAGLAAYYRLDWWIVSLVTMVVIYIAATVREKRRHKEAWAKYQRAMRSQSSE